MQPPSGPDAGFEEYMAAQTNPVQEAGSLLAHLGATGCQTLTFTQSRKNAELGAKYATAAASDQSRTEYVDVEPYHAGLGKETRRGTEYQFKTGHLEGLTSTSALELGIDIGSVDATILTGYPVRGSRSGSRLAGRVRGRPTRCRCSSRGQTRLISTSSTIPSTFSAMRSKTPSLTSKTTRCTPNTSSVLHTNSR